MFKMRRKAICIFLACIMAVSLMACDSGLTAPTSDNASEPSADASKDTQTAGQKNAMNLKVGHVGNEEHSYQYGLLAFKDYVEGQTNGGITIEIFPNGALGGERDMIEAMQMGTLDMCVSATAQITGFDDKFMILDLPFLFQCKDHAYEVLNGDIGKKLLATLDDVGLKGFSYFEVGFRNFTNNKRPIVTPADLKGLKIRCMETPVHLKSIEVWGGSATPMAMGEVYTALQQNTIDGQENPHVSIDSFKVYEVQKYLSISEHFYTTAVLMMQGKIWDALSDEDKAIFDKASALATDAELEHNAKVDAESLAKFKEAGMQVNEVDKSSFQAYTDQIYSNFANQIDMNMVADIQKLGEKYK